MRMRHGDAVWCKNVFPEQRECVPWEAEIRGEGRIPTCITLVEVAACLRNKPLSYPAVSFRYCAE